jgi:hypothetical protein
MEGFGQGGFAGVPWRRQMFRPTDGPAMMSIATTQEGDDETGVNEDGSGHSWSLSDAAFFGH